MAMRLLASLCASFTILSVAAAVGIQLPSCSTLDHIVSRLRSQLVEDVTVRTGFPGTRIVYYRNRNKYTLTYYSSTSYLKIDGIHELLPVEGRELARVLEGTFFAKKGVETGDACGLLVEQSSSRAGGAQLPSSVLDFDFTLFVHIANQNASHGTGLWPVFRTRELLVAALGVAAKLLQSR